MPSFAGSIPAAPASMFTALNLVLRAIFLCIPLCGIFEKMLLFYALIFLRNGETDITHKTGQSYKKRLNTTTYFRTDVPQEQRNRHSEQNPHNNAHILFKLFHILSIDSIRIEGL